MCVRMNDEDRVGRMRKGGGLVEHIRAFTYAKMQIDTDSLLDR